MVLIKKTPILMLMLFLSCSGVDERSSHLSKRSNIRATIRRPSSQDGIDNKFTLPRMTESEFNMRLEKEVEKYTAVIVKSLEEPEQRAIQRIKKKVVEVVIANNPYHHVKELLIKHGKGAAVVAAITEVITVGILPAIFTASGMTGLAAFSAGSPSFALTVPAFIAWKNIRLKKKLAAELGFSNLKELDELRNTILGFNVKTKLVSKVFETAEGSAEINIIKRRFAKWRNAPKGNIVDLYEVERIAQKHIEPRVLEVLKPLAKEDPAVYATMLMNRIQQSPGALGDLSSFIKENMKDLPFSLSNHQQTQLLLVHEKQAYISQLKSRLRILKSKYSKKAGEHNLLKANKKQITEYFENLINDLEYLDMDIKKFEYNFLNKIHLGETVSEQSVDNSSFALLERMKKVEEAQEYFSKNLKDLSGEDKINFKQLVSEMADSNKVWMPYGVAKNKTSCVGIVGKIISI